VGRSLRLIAGKLKELIESVRHESIYLNYGKGTLGAWSRPRGRRRDGCRAPDELRGGYLNHYGDYSAAQIESALPYTFGNTGPTPG